MPDPVDLPAIRAEGRRIMQRASDRGWSRADFDDIADFMEAFGPVLLADPTPGDRLTEDWEPTPGERVLFEEDGNWVTGTVVTGEHRRPWAIEGDRGGIHSGPIVFADERWVWPLAPIIDRLTEAPTLTEEEQLTWQDRAALGPIRSGAMALPEYSWHRFAIERLLAIIDRLSGSGEQHAVPTAGLPEHGWTEGEQP